MAAPASSGGSSMRSSGGAAYSRHSGGSDSRGIEEDIADPISKPQLLCGCKIPLCQKRSHTARNPDRDYFVCRRIGTTIPTSYRARLDTILSRKAGLDAPQPLPERRRPEAWRAGGRRRKARGRSLSELEFEVVKVKVLRDLGFTFSEAEVDDDLASIVPGLRRLRAAEEEAKKSEAAACAEEEACRNMAASATALRRRLYLSEADVRRMLSTFRIPAADDGADLKEHLRLWARSVASAVR